MTAELDRRLNDTREVLGNAASAQRREAGEMLEAAARSLADGAVLVLVAGETLQPYPAGRLLYHPGLAVGGGPEPDPLVFARAEAIEFRQRNYQAASEAYRALARSSDLAIRAGALLRLGRSLRKSGSHEDALVAYSSLAELGAVAVGGLPAHLIGSYGRLEVLHQLGRESDLRRDAALFRKALATGEWAIGPGTYQYYREDLDRLAPGDSPGREGNWREAVSEGAAELWRNTASRRSGGDGAGHDLISTPTGTTLLLWQSGAELTAGFIATEEFIASEWLSAPANALTGQGMSLALSDAAGSLPTGGPAVTHEVTRTPGQTGLPWTISVALRDPAAVLADLGDRRRLLTAGLVLLGAVILFGGYAVTRAVRRELAVSRLQAEFVSAVSHEFRTPLTSMRQLSELLSSGRVASEERRRQYYQVIDRETQRLHRLVEGLLDFGRMEAGAREFAREPLELTELVRGVVAEFQAERPEVDLTIGEAPSPVELSGDSEAITRALWNLLDNAVKYSPEGAPVAVAVESLGDRVAVSVTDRGIGIPPEEIDTVFEKFVRGSSAHSIPAKGTGLGLAMVRHIVEAHGGRVEVASNGAGSTFTLVLPVREAA